MKKKSYTLFISDLHLQPKYPAITQSFLQLLVDEAKQADALYILGDLFDSWIGDDDTCAFNQSIIQALHQASTQGLSIYFIAGNRDFLISQRFANACGITLLPDPSLIKIYGKEILLMHGDNLCTFDRLHQFWYRLTRHRHNQTLALKIPLTWRRKLAAWLRLRSQQHQKAAADYKLDVNPAAVNQVMQHYQANLLIHGHTHRPAIHTFTLNEHPATRIVLGAWHGTQTSVLRYDFGRNLRLELLELMA